MSEWLQKLSLLAVVQCNACQSADEIHFMDYNIHAGRDASGADNLQRIASLIGDMGPDVVALQEVDRNTKRSGNVDQLETLSQLTGMFAAFGKTLDFQGGQYGIGFLSRWPIVRHSIHPLPIDPPQERAGGSYEPRGALVVEVDSPFGTLVAINTHLQASQDDRYRMQEVATVQRLADRFKSRYAVIISGDFNSQPDSRVVSEMVNSGWLDTWELCGAGEGQTYPARNPARRIDYVFVEQEMTCAVARVEQNLASDHLPLVVELIRQ